MNDSALRTGRNMLETANNLAQAGEEVRLRVDGVGSIEVQSVLFDDTDSEIAKILCWSSDGKSSISWIVPCRSIRGVQIRESRSVPSD